MTVNIRPYRAADMPACMAIFASNLPVYFHPDEGADFEQYLTQGPSHYFVAEDGRRVVGCGGYFIDEKREVAGMTWGMVLNSEHDRGIGSSLLRVRLKEIGADYPDVRILLETSQHTYRFFEKFGFVVKSIKADGFGPGLDCYHMEIAPVRASEEDFRIQEKSESTHDQDLHRRPGHSQ